MDAATLWYDDRIAARLARGVLTPLELLYRGSVAVRNAMYDTGWLHTFPTAVPALSVGNLSAGGTGKTPVAAHVARALSDAGGTPAVALRGYGDDETRVHALLNPDVPVLSNADRVAASATARDRGCDVVVLDDAFQHRRAARVADVVLLAAEQWTHRVRCLPCGPYREPLRALRRASLVLVTRKAATIERAESVREALLREALLRGVGGDVGIVALHLDALCPASGPRYENRPVSALSGRDVLGVAGIGTPSAFARQLEEAGARVTRADFADHHPFGAADAESLARRAEAVDFVVCTLKDAVKLVPLWPRAAPALWYVSQRVEVERGVTSLNAVLRRVLDARAQLPSTNAG